MLFHQIQLMVCGNLARRYALRNLLRPTAPDRGPQSTLVLTREVHR
jgi:hypothetical protein